MKQYAVKHSLYREALELYKYQAEQLREMTLLYADYLYSQNDYQEAAIGKEQARSSCLDQLELTLFYSLRIAWYL